MRYQIKVYSTGKTEVYNSEGVCLGSKAPAIEWQWKPDVSEEDREDARYFLIKSGIRLTEAK